MKQISLSEVNQRAGLQPVTISEKAAPVWDPVDRPPGMLAARDGLLHFATEATPDGFSCASSLSGLSIDEPPINKDSELWASVSLAAVQEEKTGVVEMGLDRRVNLSMESPAQCVGRKSEGDKSELLEDSDDDADILKECINSAMPTKSLASKTKKEGEGGQKCPATQIGAKRESQLPLFRHRIDRHTTVSAGDGLTHDTPRIYHTEGTQSAFSAATSLSDLTIDSSTDEPGGLHNMGRAGTRHSEGDILAECISAAMPKGRSQRPHRVHRIMVQAQQSSDSGRPRQQQHFVPSRLPKPCRESFDASGKSSATGRPAAGFAADSPHHFTPIEGTPYCFSRNDSLSSLDFDDDDGDLSKAKEELKKDWRHLPRKPSQDDYGKRLATTRLGKNNKLTNADVLQKTRVADRAQGQPVLCSGDVPRGKSCSDSLQQTESTTEERLRSFAVEDTPVCFSRNSSLSSLSDIDRDDNGNAGGSAVTRSEGPASVAQQRRTALQARGKAGDTSRAYRVEGTPACFSRNSSLSSLSVESEDDLLQECISSAMPQKRRTNGRMGARVEQRVAVDHSGRRAVSMDKEGNAAEFRAENVASPESESFDWKAIQEGANSIVSSLHQAAAAAAAAAIETPGSLSRQASSDSDSILSLVSGLSLGSPLHAIADREDSTSPTLQNSTPRGPRISKDKVPKASLEAPKAVCGGKKVYRSGITGKARPNVDSQTQVSQSLSASVAIRGRANTPSPALRNPSANTSAAPKKGLFKPQATSGPSGLTRAKVSGVLRGNSTGSVNRSISAPARTDGASLIKPSSSGRGGITVANNMRVQRSAARSPAPLSGRMSASPASTPGASRLSASPARNSFPSGLRRASATGSRNGGSSPSAPSSRSSSSSNLACLTSSNGGTNLAYARPTFANRTRTSTGGSKLGAGNSGGVRTTKGSSLKRTELTQAASTRSSESESEHAEKPVSLVRQSTFVKEAPSPDLRDALKASSASCESVSGNRGGHKHMEKSQDIFGLMSSGFRSRSRSPGHVASGRNGTWKREGGSRPSSSLPRVGTWHRAGSSSSILSASSESSDKTRGGVCGGGSEGGTDPPVISKAIPPKELKQPHGPSAADSSAMLVKTVEDGNHGPTPPSSLCGLWRKTSDPAETQEHLVEPPMAPAVSKTEDVWVRIEDCPINSPRSGKLEEGDDKAPAFSPAATPDNEMVSTERTTPLSSANSSKHSSPGGSTTVSARVTPFNYTPSPQRRGASEPSTARPSQIPTPVPNKRRDPSKTITSPEAAEDAKVHSGSFLVTSV